MGTLNRRLRRLEQSSGGECPRCSGVVSVTVNGDFDSATRDGVPMSEAEWRQHEGEEVEGLCPVCGREPLTITIPPQDKPKDRARLL